MILTGNEDLRVIKTIGGTPDRFSAEQKKERDGLKMVNT